MRLVHSLAAGLCLAAASAGLATADSKKDENSSSCGNYGTTIEFLETPKEAAAAAKKAGKLVLVLHVSGNFEDPQFT